MQNLTQTNSPLHAHILTSAGTPCLCVVHHMWSWAVTLCSLDEAIRHTRAAATATIQLLLSSDDSWDDTACISPNLSLASATRITSVLAYRWFLISLLSQQDHKPLLAMFAQHCPRSTILPDNQSFIQSIQWNTLALSSLVALLFVSQTEHLEFIQSISSVGTPPEL